MKLERRLKTIERKLNLSVSSFCLCYGINLKYEVVPITIDEWKRRFDTGEEKLERLPDFCNRCRKQVDKRFIEKTFEQMQETHRRRMKQVIETMAKFAD
jgi:hypothetical protein